MTTVEKINEIYKELNAKYVEEMPIPDREFQLRLINDIDSKMHYFPELDEYKIQCDAENNPPEIIGNNCMIAKISWHNPLVRQSKESSYVVLIFGREEQVKQLQQKYVR